MEYTSYAELSRSETEDIDYRIVSTDRGTSLAILAIHGGAIEPGTSEVASALADKLKASCYLFEGIKPKNNGSLHITSTAFDEPAGRSLAEKADTILSIHGCSGDESEFAYIGGLNEHIKERIKEALHSAGYLAEQAPTHLLGESKENIVNRCQTGKGVQLELSAAFRKSLFIDGDLSRKGRLLPSAEMDRFVAVLAKAIQDACTHNENP